MALADSVPGVSGGTIAFLMGFYDNFIGSLNALISGSKQERIQAVKYLIKLGIGWAIGFCSSVLVLANVFESHIYRASSLFIGFIIFAIPVVIYEEKKVLKDRWKMSFFVLIGMAFVVAITYANTFVGGGKDLSNPGIGMYIYDAPLVLSVTLSAMPAFLLRLKHQRAPSGGQVALRTLSATLSAMPAIVLRLKHQRDLGAGTARTPSGEHAAYLALFATLFAMPTTKLPIAPQRDICPGQNAHLVLSATLPRSPRLSYPLRHSAISAPGKTRIWFYLRHCPRCPQLRCD